MPKIRQSKSKQNNLFRDSVPEMPEGYYSQHQANLNLRKFVENHIMEKPYDPESDNYQVESYNRSHLVSAERSLQRMHGYWTKKPYTAIQDYVLHYTDKDDLILDPFCGSGSTSLVSLFEGRKSIAIDISPSATFITRHYCTPVSIESSDYWIDKIIDKCNKDTDNLYQVDCPECNGKAEINFLIYSECYQCLRCLENIPICIAKKIKSKRSTYLCNSCSEEKLDISGGIKDHLPVKANISCGCSRRSIIIDRYKDIKGEEFFKDNLKSNFEKANIALDKYWFPKNEYPRYTLSHRLHSKGIRRADQLFTPLNLAAMATILNSILEIPDDKVKELLRGHFSALINGLSRMARETRTSNVGTFYYCPMISRQTNVFKYFKKRYDKELREALSIVNTKIQTNKIIISTQSACDLTNIPANSVDYVFTDPPYGGKVPYGELNLNWEFWLDMPTDWIDGEIIVNHHQDKDEDSWRELMFLAFKEIYRVLKPGRWLTLCYHDTSEGTWFHLQEILNEVGFIPDKSTKAIYIETREKAYKKKKDDENVQRRDLVINLRKPRPNEISSEIFITGEEDKKTFAEKIALIITDYLIENPGAKKDRIFDEVVSRMIRQRLMEPHNFDQYLRRIAEPMGDESNRWYLKESELDLADSAESAKEDSAAELVEGIINSYLDKNPHEGGVHYSDLFEDFVYAVMDKPRRSLLEWLPDYFYRTENGAYRPPGTEQEKSAKVEARKKGTNRRIKRYVSLIDQGLEIPANDRPNDSTMAEWIRHCKLSGLYEYGRILYEKGGINLDNLSEETMINVEEDYQVCVRIIGRKKK